MRVLIDSDSGCCNGVRMAIEKSEEFLKDNDSLYSLGAIVHNGAEIARLSELGMKTIGYDYLSNLKNETVLIRAHGEPPSTYATLEKLGVKYIDCTCPVVLGLQRKIAAKYGEISPLGGKILIFGKSGHAEVNGLVGQVSNANDVMVVESLDSLKDRLAAGQIDLSKPLAVFSQTTKDPAEYHELCDFLRENSSSSGDLSVYNTICGQVSSRRKKLEKFASECSVILFVCGKESSNGKVLYDLCKNINPRSYKIEGVEDIDLSQIKSDDVVGICGATSTTHWQLEKIAEYVNNFISLHAKNQQVI